MANTVTIFGNGGELSADAVSGAVLDYRPSEEVESGDHDGYGDVVAVDLAEWCAYWQLSEPAGHIDILDVRATLQNGTVIEPESDWREMIREDKPAGCIMLTGKAAALLGPKAEG